MKKCFITIIFLTLIFISYANGQEGIRQAGLRTGYRGGLYYQVTNRTGNAETGYMAMAGFHNNGVQITGLRIIYEISLSDISPDLYLAWGYGAHAGFMFTNQLAFFGEKYYFRNDRFCPLVGVDGWAAAEYRFRNIPLIISVNIKPYVELTLPSFLNIMPADVGISVSYLF
ncbi:MAG: hypothetical protein C0408_00630 [Odoribacter sp.]|nr:hypothetical protein [Odoribacter sp.]